MNLEAGLLKLKRIIASKRALENRLTNTKEDAVLVAKIAEHQRTINTLKESLDFDIIFEVETKVVEVPVKAKGRKKNEDK